MSPCYDCSYRTEKCHARCKAYMEFKAAVDKLRDIRHKETMIEEGLHHKKERRRKKYE